MRPDFLNEPTNGIYYLTEPKKSFEDSYLRVRKKEGRLLEDDIVQKLPILPESHSHYSEWKKRQFTLRKFLKYTSTKKFKTILDVGCGNGWFTSQISKNSELTIGVDVITNELEQASRCFQKESLFFICCDDLENLPQNYFDCICFNASIQYFNWTPKFWSILNSLLCNNGEIHVMDSPVYYQKDVVNAQIRSKTYFEKIGEPKANSYYRHLIWNFLPKGYTILYRPSKIKIKLFRNQSPFPWFMIQKRL